MGGKHRLLYGLAIQELDVPTYHDLYIIVAGYIGRAGQPFLTASRQDAPKILPWRT